MWDNYVHQKWLIVTRGLVTLFAGLILMANPDKAMRVLMTILGFYFLLEAAILTILVLVEEQKDDAWWTFFCQGMIALMAGCLIVFFPQITLAGLIFVMASWILTVGICNLFISLQTGNAKFEGELILKIPRTGLATTIILVVQSLSIVTYTFCWDDGINNSHPWNFYNCLRFSVVTSF